MVRAASSCAFRDRARGGVNSWPSKKAFLEGDERWKRLLLTLTKPAGSTLETNIR